MEYKLLRKKNIFILDESLGGKIFEGNKFRKSKYLLNYSIKQGIITFGSKYSNHSLAMAYFCSLKKKKLIYLLVDKEKVLIQNFKNLKIIKDLGAEIIQIKSSEVYNQINFYKKKI